MSGPIVRKYGFPNFEKIFGPKPVLHGIDEETTPQGQEGGREPSPASKPLEPEAGSPREASGDASKPVR